MIKDLEIREQAARDFSRSWSVEASAGTGKTTLLATRYANLLEESGGQIASIVAITFTEKAAHELKERIESILRERNPAHASLPLLKNAYISTIHAFCMRILKEKSLEAGIDPEFKMIDPLTAYSFLKQCFMDWLEALSAKEWQSLLRCISMGLSLDQIRQTALDLYRYRDMQDKINLEFSADSEKVSLKFREICARLKHLRVKAESSCADPADAGYVQIVNLYTLAEQGERLLDTPEEWERFFIHRFKIPAGKGTQKGWKPPTDLALQKTALTEMSLELEALKSDLRRGAFFKLLQTLKSFTTYVETKKAEKSYVDFDDLLFKTKTLLATQPEVLAALRHKFDFFLIDEYQDTDPLQAEIIWRLCSEGYEETWLHNPLVPSKLFLVGDPKQSIYRFRRASIEIYEETTRRVVEQGGRLVIDQNFRSSAPVVAAVNHMFRAIFNESYSDISSLSSHLFSTSPAVHILKVTDAPLKLGADDQRKLEANMIAAFIQDTLRKNEPIVFDRKAERLRPAKQGDFAVLFPTTTGMDFYEEAFRHHDLSFSVEGGSAFFHRLEIHGAICVLRAVITPRDAISVVAALKSVILGLSDQQIFELSKVIPTFDYRKASPSVTDPVVQEALTILNLLHQDHIQRPSILLSKLYELAWTLPISMLRFHGEQASANLLKLVSIARHLEQQGLQSLRGFLDWVEETAEQKSQETEAFLSEKDDEHINFMTIHRSKGLEFPIVILANASGQSRAHSEQILCDRTQGWIEVGIGPESERFSTVHYEEKLAHEKKCHEDEQKRLLYVAMTRARDKIILPKFTADEKKPSLLWSYLEKSLDGLEPQPLEISASALETFEKTTAVAPPQKNGDFEVLQELYEHFSPTAVAEVQPPTEALQISHGRNMGTLFHHTLERIDLKAKNHAMILQELCEEKGLLFLKPSVEALIERFYNMPIYARLCAAEAIYREVPWSYADQGRLFEGTIDCIFKDAEGYHILDYKTDQTLDESSETYAAYKEQIGFYAHAFERMFNLKPTSLILVFVSVEQEKIVL